MSKVSLCKTLFFYFISYLSSVPRSFKKVKCHIGVGGRGSQKYPKNVAYYLNRLGSIDLIVSNEWKIVRYKNVSCKSCTKLALAKKEFYSFCEEQTHTHTRIKTYTNSSLIHTHKRTNTHSHFVQN